MVTIPSGYFFEALAADNAAVDSDGPAAERTGGNTDGPAFQQDTRLVRESPAYTHD
jgi:hypothetical protein